MVKIGILFWKDIPDFHGQKFLLCVPKLVAHPRIDSYYFARHANNEHGVGALIDQVVVFLFVIL